MGEANESQGTRPTGELGITRPPNAIFGQGAPLCL